MACTIGDLDSNSGRRGIRSSLMGRIRLPEGELAHSLPQSPPGSETLSAPGICHLPCCAAPERAYPNPSPRVSGELASPLRPHSLTLASCSPLPTCLLNLTRSTSIPLPEALLTCTLHPAQLLRGPIASSKGQLTVGYDADLCVFGWDGAVKSTWVDGVEVWRDESVKGDYFAGDPGKGNGKGDEVGMMRGIPDGRREELALGTGEHMG